MELTEQEWTAHIKKHRPLVLMIAKRQWTWAMRLREQASTQITAIVFQDVLDVGMAALWKASRDFDPSRGFQFSTLAYKYIKQDIGNFLRAEEKHARSFPCDPASLQLTLLAKPQKRGPEEFRSFCQWLDGADKRQRLAIIMIYWMGYNGVEVGEQLGISRERVRQIIKKHFDALRDRGRYD